jgi:hypothetical protein
MGRWVDIYPVLWTAYSKKGSYFVDESVVSLDKSSPSSLGTVDRKSSISLTSLEIFLSSSCSVLDLSLTWFFVVGEKY